MPTNRKQIVKDILEALGLNVADLAEGAGFNSRQALNRYFKKESDLSIDLYAKLIEYLEQKDKNIVSSIAHNSGNIEGSGVVIAGSKLDKSKVKEVNNFKCAYNAKELHDIFESALLKSLQGYDKLLAEKDERIKDLKEVIEMLKNQRAK